jgi:hypothetical protein
METFYVGKMNERSQIVEIVNRIKIYSMPLLTVSYHRFKDPETVDYLFNTAFRDIQGLELTSVSFSDEDVQGYVIERLANSDILKLTLDSCEWVTAEIVSQLLRGGEREIKLIACELPTQFYLDLSQFIFPLCRSFEVEEEEGGQYIPITFMHKLDEIFPNLEHLTMNNFDIWPAVLLVAKLPPRLLSLTLKENPQLVVDDFWQRYFTGYFNRLPLLTSLKLDEDLVEVSDFIGKRGMIALVQSKLRWGRSSEIRKIPWELFRMINHFLFQ